MQQTLCMQMDRHGALAPRDDAAELCNRIWHRKAASSKAKGFESNGRSAKRRGKRHSLGCEHEERIVTAILKKQSALEPASGAYAPDPRWEPFENRDKAADGQFVAGVTTTGIYCRPGCPARLPRRENVRFFASAAEAERAGFRPCKRCRPDAASIEERLTAAVREACALIEAAEGAPDFEAIAAAAGVSRHHLHRAFKRIVGVTPGAYFRGLREGRAAAGLKAGASVTEAIYDAGYGSASRFYETLAPKLGLKPGAYARGGEGEVIRFAVGECSLGSILVAATEKGVCCIELGGDSQALVEDLQHRFRKARLVGGDAGFEEIVAAAATQAARRSWRRPVAWARTLRAGWACRCMCAGRRSSSRFGRRCAASGRAGRRRIRKLRRRLAYRARCEPLAARLAATRLPWRSRVTG